MKSETPFASTVPSRATGHRGLKARVPVPVPAGHIFKKLPLVSLPLWLSALEAALTSFYQECLRTDPHLFEPISTSLEASF